MPPIWQSTVWRSIQGTANGVNQWRKQGRRLRRPQTSTLCSALRFDLPSANFPFTSPSLALRSSIAASRRLLPWPESQDRWSTRADAPPPPLPQRGKKTKAASKANKTCWRASRFIQLIRDLTKERLFFYRQVERNRTGGRQK